MSQQYTQGDRLLVAYGHVYGPWYERILLARIHEPWWVVRTSNGDMFAEDLNDNAGVLRLGVRGGLPRRFGNRHRVRFGNWELADWMEDPETGQTDNPDAYSMVPPPMRPPAWADEGVRVPRQDRPRPPSPDWARTVWVALEARVGYQVGDPINRIDIADMVTVADRAVVSLRSGDVLAAAERGSL